jgi:hypothetical protein
VPLYECEDRDGNIVELFMNTSEIRPIGEWFEHEGREVRQLPPRKTGICIKDHAFVSQSLQEYHPDARKFNSEGQPVFENKRDREEFLARNRDNPNTDNVVWNA